MNRFCTFSTTIGLAIFACLTPTMAEEDAAEPAAEEEQSSLLPENIGESKATLRWKFVPGGKRRYAMTQNITMSMNVGGRAIETKMNQNMVMSWDVNEVDEAGNCKMTQTTDAVRLKLAGPIAGEYDSVKGTKFAGPLAAMNTLYDAMLGGEFTMSISRQGRISDMEMPEGLSEALGGAPGVMSEDSLKQMIAHGTQILPEDEVSSGDKWHQLFEIDTPPIGKMKTNTEYIYHGLTKRDGRALQVFSMKPEMSFAGKGPMTPKIDGQKCQGVALFDNEQGCLVESNLRQHTDISMTISGQNLKQTISQTVAMRELKPDENPLAQDGKAKRP